MSSDGEDVYDPSPDELTRTAFHEAGHAVLQFALNLGCKSVTIEADYLELTAGASTHGGEWGTPASALGEDDDDTASLRLFAEEAFFTRHAIACYGGAEAVHRWQPTRDDWREGADSDYDMARDMLDDATGGDQQSSIHLEAYAKRRSEVLVENYWPEIVAVSTSLLESKQLSGEDVRKLFIDSLKSRRGHLVTF